MSSLDTIFSFSTGEGISAVAILRISGQKCGLIAETVFGRRLAERRVELVKFKDPRTDYVLDQGLGLSFTNPHSFTGEDCLEFHCHGSVAVKASIVRVLLGFEGCRLAVAGEFTRRAFLNGKMDLTGVEALADLLVSKTEKQQYQALGLMEGRLSDKESVWRGLLVQGLARLESVIDFSDEGDVSIGYSGEIVQICRALTDDMESALGGARGGEIVRDGFRVVLCGAVNSGKSSLLNAFAGRDVAIVSSVPGTTRDLIEIELDLGGSLVRVSDSAGIRRSVDIVEAEGIARGIKAAEAADLVLWLWECGGSDLVDNDIMDCNTEVVKVMTKCDLDDLSHGAYLLNAKCIEPKISVLTGYGLDQLIQFLTCKVVDQVGGIECGLVVRERQRALLEGCCRHVHNASLYVESGEVEIVAEEFKLAADCLGRITGRVGVEEVLGEVFSRFCVGK